MVAEDIYNLVEILASPEIPQLIGRSKYLLGDHQNPKKLRRFKEEISPEVDKAMTEVRKCLNGEEIWRQPKLRGLGNMPF